MEIVERSANFSLDLDARAGAIGDWSTFGPHQEDIRRCGYENQFDFKSLSNVTSSCFVKVPVNRHDCQDSLAKHVMADETEKRIIAR